MKLSTLPTTAVFAGVWTSIPALAAEFGSPKEAKAMHGKAVAEVKKDKNGKAFGQEMLKVAEGKIKEVTCMWPNPGETDPVQKVSYVTRIGDQICGVGYYKP
jgi:hypothetical protein